MRKKPKVAVLIENNYQEMEVWCPIYRLLEAGAEVSVVGPAVSKYTSKLGYPIMADIAAEAAVPEDFDLIVIPGGFAPDLMRVCKPMIRLVREAGNRGTPIAAICHGTWIMISAGLVKNKKATCAPSIVDDLVNAGGIYECKDVVVDNGLITSRNPSDIPAFMREIMRELTERFGKEPWNLQ